MHKSFPIEKEQKAEMHHIFYKGRTFRQVRLNISGTAPFHEILKQMDNLTIPDSPLDDEYIRYAILELINNSLRAHREKHTKDNIIAEFEARDKVLMITITDKGGGFDVSSLPYDIREQVDSIDTDSGKFQEYREKNHYKKFGMGLVVARRLFPMFTVEFYDASGAAVPYEPDKVVGTRIEMGIGWGDV